MPTIYTIGHSNHGLPEFLALLARQRIEVLVDVRSRPYSRYTPHFAAQALQAAVTGAGCRYLFLGRELGGRPEGAEYYDDSGRVDYARVARSSLFRAGIDRLHAGVARYRVALLCAEEDPTGCHRRRLVGRVLAEEGVAVLHIRGDTTINSEAEIAAAEAPAAPTNQLSLFGEMEKPVEWKSIRSVLPGGPRRTSSPP